MGITSHPLQKSRTVKSARKFVPAASTRRADTLPAARLSGYVDSWLVAGDVDGHSARTVISRKDRMADFLWFVADKGYAEVGCDEIRAFLQYLRHGHEGATTNEAGKTVGRFGKVVRKPGPLSPGSVRSYFSSVRTFCRWCVKEGYCTVSPTDRIEVPIDRPDQVQPFTEDQVRALLLASVRSKPGTKSQAEAALTRDPAVLLLLLDTGIRASECCQLNIEDVDLSARQVRVRVGKGGKARTVPFSRTTYSSLYRYMTAHAMLGLPGDSPFFCAARGANYGNRLTREGLRKLVERIAHAAGIYRENLGPHTLRHTFAYLFLKHGGDVFTLQTLMGHTSPSVTRRYVALAQADITAKHAAASPVERLLGEGRNRR